MSAAKSRYNIQSLRLLAPSIDKVLESFPESVKGLAAAGPDKIVGVSVDKHNPDRRLWKMRDDIWAVERALTMAYLTGPAMALALLTQTVDILLGNEKAKVEVDLFTARKVASLAADLAVASHEAIRQVVAGGEVQFVILLPAMNALASSLGIRKMSAMEIFDPGVPDVSHLEMLDVEDEESLDVRNASKLCSRWDRVFTALKEATDKAGLDKAITQARRFFEALLRSGPKHSLLPILVAWRGDLAILQLSQVAYTGSRGTEREAKLRCWGGVRAALEKWSHGNQSLSRETLTTACLPLLEDYPKTWKILSPLLVETDTVLGIEEWRHRVEEATHEHASGMIEFSRNRERLSELVTAVHAGWDKLFAGRGNRAAFSAAVVALLARLEDFPIDGFDAVLSNLGQIAETLTARPKDAIDEELKNEVGGALVFLDGIVHHGDPYTEESIATAKLLSLRLEAALTRRFRDLAKLPPLRLPSAIFGAYLGGAVGAVIDDLQDVYKEARKQADEALKETATPQHRDQALQVLAVSLMSLSSVVAVMGYVKEAQKFTDFAHSLEAVSKHKLSPGQELRPSIETCLGSFATLIEKINLNGVQSASEGGVKPPPKIQSIVSLSKEPEPSGDLTLGEVDAQADLDIQHPAEADRNIEASDSPTADEEAAEQEEILGEMLRETRTNLSSITDSLAGLGVSPRLVREDHHDVDVRLGDIRRVFHTIKGSAGLCDLSNLSTAAAAVEEVCDEWFPTLKRWNDDYGIWVETVAEQFNNWTSEVGRVRHDIQIPASWPPAFPALPVAASGPRPVVEEAIGEDLPMASDFSEAGAPKPAEEIEDIWISQLGSTPENEPSEAIQSPVSEAELTPTAVEESVAEAALEAGFAEHSALPEDEAEAVSVQGSESVHSAGSEMEEVDPLETRQWSVLEQFLKGEEGLSVLAPVLTALGSADFSATGFLSCLSQWVNQEGEHDHPAGQLEALVSPYVALALYDHCAGVPHRVWVAPFKRVPVSASNPEAAQAIDDMVEAAARLRAALEDLA